MEIVYIAIAVIIGIILGIFIRPFILTERVRKDKQVKEIKDSHETGKIKGTYAVNEIHNKYKTKEIEMKSLIERAIYELQRMSKVIPLADKKIIDDLEEVQKHLDK